MTQEEGAVFVSDGEDFSAKIHLTEPTKEQIEGSKEYAILINKNLFVDLFTDMKKATSQKALTEDILELHAFIRDGIYNLEDKIEEFPIEIYIVSLQAAIDQEKDEKIPNT